MINLKKLMLVIFISVFSITNAFSEKEIKIGVMLHLTGDLAMQGNAFREGIELANNLRKENYKVKLIFEDTELLPSKVQKAAKKLIEFDKVDVAMISTFQETKVAGPLFEKAKIPLICLWDSSPVLDDMGEYLFSTGTWLPFTGKVTSEFAYNKLKARKAAIISVIGDWSSLITNDFTKNFKALGGEVVYQDTYNHGETDFRTLLLKIKKQNPDVIYAPVDYGMASFFKTLKVLNITAPVIQSDNLNLEWINNLGELLEGVYQSQTLNPDNEVVENFKKEYKNYFKKEPTELLYNSWGYDALRMIFEVIKENGSSSSQITSGLYKVNNFDGAIGKISINKKGSHRMGVNMLKIVNGKFVEIK